MRVIEFIKHKADDGWFDMAVFLEGSITYDDEVKYLAEGYHRGYFGSVADWVSNMTDTATSDGECLDMLVELCDKGCIKGSIK